jgi:hypothetical protein
MKPQIVVIPREPLSREISDRQQIAKTLFCSSEFAMIEFRQMDAEDWKLHAARAWEVAGIFVSEIKQLKRP